MICGRTKTDMKVVTENSTKFWYCGTPWGGAHFFLKKIENTRKS